MCALCIPLMCSGALAACCSGSPNRKSVYLPCTLQANDVTARVPCRYQRIHHIRAMVACALHTTPAIDRRTQVLAPDTWIRQALPVDPGRVCMLQVHAALCEQAHYKIDQQS
jgi:hypothetical protein